MDEYKYIKFKQIGGMNNFDDNDLFENGTGIIDLTKASTTTWLTLDPYKLSIYNISVLKRAIKLGYDVNKKNKNGVTLLHCYARKKQSNSVMKSVKLLLENGADPLILTNKGISVLDIAMQYNHQVAKLLITKYHVPASDTYKQILKIN